MPISTRSDADPTLGNQAAPTLFAAPVGIVDPVESMKRFHEIVQSARHEPALDVLAGAADVLVHLPDRLMSSPLAQLVKVDFAASQVKGLLTPTYLAGAQIMRAYGFGPKVALAAFIGMMTHLDTCCIAVHADPAAITDPEVFIRSLQDGLRRGSGQRRTPRRHPPGRKKRPRAPRQRVDGGARRNEEHHHGAYGGAGGFSLRPPRPVGRPRTPSWPTRCSSRASASWPSRSGCRPRPPRSRCRAISMTW